MVERTLLARQWRDRGAELRAIAETLRTRPARLELITLAQLWEQLAEFSEGRALPPSRTKAEAKARSLRVEARGVRHAERRQRLLGLAEQYELLGETVDEAQYGARPVVARQRLG